MVYIDNIGHMISDTSLEELNSFAGNIGLKREWFQDKKYKHYDLTTARMRTKAVNNGAILVSSKEIIRILKQMK